MIDQGKRINKWIKNTIEDKLSERAKEILESNKEEVLTRVAKNAFLLKELKKKAI